MRPLQLAAPGERLSVLCLGAHSDDIEIGAGATLLSLRSGASGSTCTGACSAAPASGRRRRRASASDFLAAAQRSEIEVMSFRDGFFPEQGEAIKAWFEALEAGSIPT